jgi:AraC-like DNA-binding protein
VDLVRQLSNPRALTRHQDVAAVQGGTPAADGSRQRRPRQLQVRLTDDEVDRVVAGYQAGLTLNELATAFGADRRTLAGWLQQRGVSRRGRRFTATDVDESIRLYRDGWSLAQIGSRFGVYPQSIRYHLQKAGVELRPRPGWTPKPT